MSDSDPSVPQTSPASQEQMARFQELLEKLVSCCQGKTAHLAEKFGLPQAEIRALAVFRGERYLTVTSLTTKLDVTKSRVTKIIQGLIDKGLVESIEDPRDARVKLLSLTAKGRATEERIDAFTRALHLSILSRLRPEERSAILADLARLWEAMEEVKKEYLA